jgi:hypothetical protein
VEAALQAAPPSSAFPVPTVQAPIGLTGFAVAYEIDGKLGQQYQNLKLTPRLLAKLLTESYPATPAIRDAYSALATNPLDIGLDPEFQALNPGIPPPVFDAIPAATIFTVSSRSDVIWSLTSYINSDPAARSWLDGTPDPWGMVVNPNYKSIRLPVQSWPLLDTFEQGAAYDTSSNPCLAANPVPFLPQVAAPVSTMATVTLNMQFSIANSQVLCTNAGGLDQKLVSYGRETRGSRFLIGITPLADAARYELSSAALQTQVSPAAPSKFSDSTGRTFVAPSDASLTAASSLLAPNPSEGTWDLPYGKFQTDPAASAAYPGTLLISADIPTKGLPATDAQKYATFLDFAAFTGQTPGVGNGQLPPGFLPMTASNNLKEMAAYTRSAATAVKAQSGTVPPLPGSPPSSQPQGPSGPSANAGGSAFAAQRFDNQSGPGSGGAIGPANGSVTSASRAKHPGSSGLPAGIARAIAFITAGAGSLAFGISLIVCLLAAGIAVALRQSRKRSIRT